VWTLVLIRSAKLLRFESPWYFCSEKYYRYMSCDVYKIILKPTEYINVIEFLVEFWHRDRIHSNATTKMKGAEWSSNLWKNNKLCIICKHTVLANVDELQNTKTLWYPYTHIYIYIYSTWGHRSTFSLLLIVLLCINNRSAACNWYS